MILGPGYVLTCESFTRTYPREPFSFCHKMVALEARPSPLRIEGTSDIPARSSSSVLCIPFPIASNMVPSQCHPGSYVSIRCLFETRRISRHAQLHRLVLLPGLGYREQRSRRDPSQPKGFAWIFASDCREGCWFRCCSAGCPRSGG